MPLPAALRHRPRLEMRLARHGIPDIPLLGRYHYTRAHAALPEHAHPHALEICFLEKGRQSYRLGDTLYRLKGGDLFITPPGRRHSTGGHPEEKGVLYWMVLRMPGKNRRLLDLSPTLTRRVVRALTTLSSPHFRGSAEIKDHLDAIAALVQGPDDPLRPLALLNRVRACLLEILECARRSRTAGSANPMRAACAYVRAHLEETLPVSLLARQSGLSVPYFKARFKRELGVPPAEYVLREKVAEAERRLRQTPATVTEIAYQLGFSSSQYFATVFKRFAGTTPSAFRARRGI
jgi:AraC-like DNA-binding protein